MFPFLLYYKCMRNNQELIELLIGLKNDYCTCGIKVELSSECEKDEDLSALKDVADKLALPFTVKTSGAEDEIGICRAVNIGVQNIVVPLVESSYAIKKFVKLVRKHSSDINIFVNIETIVGYKNFDEILKESFSDIKGIIFGRNDFCASLGFSSERVDDNEIFDYAKDLSLKLQSAQKEFYVGGRVSPASIPFLKKIPYLNGFETRKLIFNAQSKSFSENAIKNALDFELLFLQSKNSTSLDKERIETLKARV